MVMASSRVGAGESVDKMRRWGQLTIIRGRTLSFLALFGLTLLAGCAETKFPTWLTGEPADSVINAPRIVRVAPSRAVAGWPNLAEVPEKPKDFSPSGESQKQMKRMQDDKAESETLRQKIQAAPAPSLPPLPVPPS